MENNKIVEEEDKKRMRRRGERLTLWRGREFNNEEGK